MKVTYMRNIFNTCTHVYACACTHNLFTHAYTIHKCIKQKSGHGFFCDAMLSSALDLLRNVLTALKCTSAIKDSVYN